MDMVCVFAKATSTPVYVTDRITVLVARNDVTLAIRSRVVTTQLASISGALSNVCVLLDLLGGIVRRKLTRACEILARMASVLAKMGPTDVNAAEGTKEGIVMFSLINARNPTLVRTASVLAMQMA